MFSFTSHLAHPVGSIAWEMSAGLSQAEGARNGTAPSQAARSDSTGHPLSTAAAHHLDHLDRLDPLPHTAQAAREHALDD
jgi:hypothetical protein